MYAYPKLIKSCIREICVDFYVSRRAGRRFQQQHPSPATCSHMAAPLRAASRLPRPPQCQGPPLTEEEEAPSVGCSDHPVTTHFYYYVVSESSRNMERARSRLLPEGPPKPPNPLLSLLLLQPLPPAQPEGSGTGVSEAFRPWPFPGAQIRLCLGARLHVDGRPL